MKHKPHECTYYQNTAYQHNRHARFSQRTKEIDIYNPYIGWIKVGKKRSTI